MQSMQSTLLSLSQKASSFLPCSLQTCTIGCLGSFLSYLEADPGAGLAGDIFSFFFWPEPGPLGGLGWAAVFTESKTRFLGKELRPLAAWLVTLQSGHCKESPLSLRPSRVSMQVEQKVWPQKMRIRGKWEASSN